METIIVAIISSLGVVATTLIQSIQANKKDKIENKLSAMNVNFDNKLTKLQDLLNTLGKCEFIGQCDCCGDIIEKYK